MFQYVRVDKDTEMKHMMTLITKYWKLEKPKLLISVTGGAKSFNMSKRLTETFQRGLIKAARSTGMLLSCINVTKYPRM